MAPKQDYNTKTSLIFNIIFYMEDNLILTLLKTKEIGLHGQQPVCRPELYDLIKPSCIK